MIEIQFYNSLSKKKEPFQSKEPGKVRIYHCGPTVYKRQHIGNMRRFLFADFLRRSLELLGYEVREITNITDVGHLTQDEIDAGEDKLEKEARAEKTTPQMIAERELKNFMEDMRLINVQFSHKYPRATAHIKSMQDMIAVLIEKGHAYVTESGVYYDVRSFPEYGQLSGNSLEQLEAGKRVEVRGEKKNPADFVLWIFDENALQKWDSPWGTGYPGWHIECSAMACEYLGTEIDIHTGGEDNRFPHHENEIAQTEGATGEKFVRVWMHNRHLQINGQKMAKREGEAITLDTLAEKGFSPLALRLLAFGSHYRTKIDFSWESLAGAQAQLESVRSLVRRLKEALPNPDEDAKPDNTVMKPFAEALADDLNTPEALAVFMSYIGKANTILEGPTQTKEQLNVIWATLGKIDHVVGVMEPVLNELSAEEVPAEVTELASSRERARAEKDFEKADQIREKVEALGFSIEDTASGPRVKPL